MAYVGDFWDIISLSDVASFDVIFCCVDNFEARIRANMLSYIARTDFVNIGIDSRFCSIETFPFSATQVAGCYECSLPDSAYKRISERYSCGHLRKTAMTMRKIATTTVTASSAGALAVSFGMGLGSHEKSTNGQKGFVGYSVGRWQRFSARK